MTSANAVREVPRVRALVEHELRADIDVRGCPDLDAALAQCTSDGTVVVAVAAPALGDAVRVFGAGGAAVVDLEDEAMITRGLVVTLQHGAFVPPALQAGVAEHLHRGRLRRNAADRVALLSARERAVLDLLGAGSDRAAVARRMRESPYQIRAHVDRAKGKLGVRSQREALALLRDARAAQDESAGRPTSA